MSTWLDELTNQALSKQGLGVWRTSDESAWGRRAQSQTAAFQSAVTSPVSGAAPKRTDFLSVTPATYDMGSLSSTGIMPTNGTRPSMTAAGYAFNDQGYSEAMYSYMRGQDKYADWSDSDIQTFISDSMNMTDDQKRAEELWTDSSVAYRKAQKDAEADRNRMLGELATYKDTMLSSTWVDDLVGQEAGRWNARNQGILNQVAQQTANMGRTVSPYLLGDLSKRLQAQASAAIQEVRVSAEQQQEQKRQYYLSSLYSVLSNTQREVMNPVTAAALIKQIAAPSTTSAGGVSVSSGSSKKVYSGEEKRDKGTSTRGTYVDMAGNVHTYLA